MTILDLISKTAIMLNIQDVINDKTDITENNQEDILTNNFALKRLYEFSKMVINEINMKTPKYIETKCNAIDGYISLDTFERLAKIICVKDKFSCVKYTQESNAIKVQQAGTYWVVFKQYPKVDSLLDEIEICGDSVTEDVYICGLNSYYCLATGLFEEFNIYNQQYTSKLDKIKNLKVFSMPCRSWEW